MVVFKVKAPIADVMAARLILGRYPCKEHYADGVWLFYATLTLEEIRGMLRPTLPQMAAEIHPRYHEDCIQLGEVYIKLDKRYMCSRCKKVVKHLPKRPHVLSSAPSGASGSP